LGRFIGSNQWFMPYIGLMYKSGRFGHDETMENIFGQNIIDRDPLLPAIGFTYLIPFNFTLQSDIMLDGSLRVQLMRDDIPITPRLKLFVMGNTDMEYEVGLKYVIKPYLGLSVNYGNMMGAGAGLSFTY
ncbi:MAG TPA: copper oxidase, partial [Chitinophagales bacterium]|nr:copper oxidase [Chitinophagales bacterium]